MNHKKILIISAMAEEMLPLTKYLSYEKLLSPGDIIEHGNFVFAVSGIGKVSAAMMLTKVLEQYGIDSIINIGLAGSLSSYLEFGDVVVVTHTVEHDGFIEWDSEAQARLYPLWDVITVEHPELKQGVLVTGDQFVASGTMRESLQAKGWQLVDMEGAALARVAHHYEKPLIVLKVISDNADEHAGENFANNLHAGERVVRHLPFILDFLINQ
jgi:adenosylhomocysteine nucleosidase